MKRIIMNKMNRVLTKTAIVTLITIAATDVYAGVVGGYNGAAPEAFSNYNPGVVKPYEKIGGKTYGDWGAEWWKWALSVPYAQSPITDATGQYGSQNQKGSVWFLAGSFGTEEDRSITIPAGKWIFFPLVNVENDYPCPDPNFKPEPGQSLEDFLTKGAAPLIDPYLTDPHNTLSAKVDGVELKHLLIYRGTSHLTSFTANPDPENLKYIDPCITGKEQVMVSDGFWIMLEPLKPGEHEIVFTAKAKSNPYPFSLHVSYHIKIKK